MKQSPVAEKFPCEVDELEAERRILKTALVQVNYIIQDSYGIDFAAAYGQTAVYGQGKENNKPVVDKSVESLSW